MQQDRLIFLRILRSPKIGLRTFYKLMDLCHGDAYQCLALLAEKNIDIVSEHSVLKELEKLKKLKGTFLFYQDDIYPTPLKNIQDAPPFLMMIGNKQLLNKQSIAIIGARNASMAGKRFVEKISHHLSDANYNIVSGLARGIDGAAHKGALNKGTIAVLPGGIDQVYPSEHQKLYNEIIEKGVVLSEMPLGLPPTAGLFPRRNRIVSGLSDALIISEAAFQSGSMITAKYALEQGREIFVIPGHPSDPRSAGGHKLIQDGAHLLHTADDVLTILNTPKMLPILPSKTEPIIPDTQKNQVMSEGILREKLLALLSSNPTNLEDILNALPGLKSHELMIEITHLELDGQIIRHDHQGISKKM
jgi:DNA processing protein